MFYCGREERAFFVCVMLVLREIYDRFISCKLGDCFIILAHVCVFISFNLGWDLFKIRIHMPGASYWLKRVTLLACTYIEILVLVSCNITKHCRRSPLVWLLPSRETRMRWNLGRLGLKSRSNVAFSFYWNVYLVYIKCMFMYLSKKNLWQTKIALLPEDWPLAAWTEKSRPISQIINK